MSDGHTHLSRYFGLMQPEPNPHPPLEILYQDDHLVAVAKPSGLLVHRSALAPDRVTCMSILREQLGRWVYPAHRLDRGTSGVLLFALDSETAARVAASLAEREVEKRYLVVVRGFAPESGRIDYPLAEEPELDAVEAITAFARLASVELPYPVGRYATARYSLVQADPKTGRRHQIRRHMAHLRHPVIGDTMHGEGRHNRLFREVFGVHRLLLHARRLRFAHPYSGATLDIQSPLPDELRILFEQLGFAIGDESF